MLMGISFGEIFFIIIAALIILGPEEFSKIIPKIASEFFKLRNRWYNLGQQLEQQLTNPEAVNHEVAKQDQIRHVD